MYNTSDDRGSIYSIYFLLEKKENNLFGYQDIEILVKET